MVRKPQPVNNGILQAGDAAGFIDPFVGDGISLALRSGVIAAEALIENRNDLSAALERYEKRYAAELHLVHRNAADQIPHQIDAAPRLDPAHRRIPWRRGAGEEPLTADPREGQTVQPRRGEEPRREPVAPFDES